ncbi:hypothetical protein KEM48_003275 [Puccinia striiformis f. sp. tritici PST-130]|nr:hypothetical protein KEM48_003275 [Puccinia striiformis f. sp. tritici PST-130]
MTDGLILLNSDEDGSGPSLTNYNASPYAFVTWLPINGKTGGLIEDKLEVTRGQFVFPRNGFGIDFTDCLSYSCQLPQKTHNASQRIQDGFYDKPKYKDWRPRDMGKSLDDSLAYPKPLNPEPKEKLSKKPCSEKFSSKIVPKK